MVFSKKFKDFSRRILSSGTFPSLEIYFSFSRFSRVRGNLDGTTGARGGVAFLLKHGLVINKEYRNIDFNIITDNEALVIDIHLSDNQNLIWLPFTAQMEIRTLGCLKPLKCPYGFSRNDFSRKFDQWQIRRKKIFRF